jgi:hypothetical protein
VGHQTVNLGPSGTAGSIPVRPTRSINIYRVWRNGSAQGTSLMPSTMSEYQARKTKMIEYLGGACVVCGSNEDLNFDHVNSKTKNFDVSANWARRWDVLVIELDKCQLLCRPHHKEKTRTSKDHVGGHNKILNVEHGTPIMYHAYGCRCDPCRLAKKQYRNKQISYTDKLITNAGV